VIPAPPDGASLCPKGTCNFQSQEGCATAQSCSPHYNATSDKVEPTCSPTGTLTKGQKCTGTTATCARGMVCADGVCAKVCCGGDYTACDPGESCFRHSTQFMTASGSVIDYNEGLGTCAPVGDCALLDPDSCAADPKHPVCRIVDATGAVACVQNGDRKLGEACDGEHQCGRGEHCAGYMKADGSTSLATTCVRLCRYGSCNSKPGCPDGEGPCVHFLRDPEGIGECTAGWKGPGQEVDVPGDAGLTDASPTGSP
jgi:hypothetical protein